MIEYLLIPSHYLKYIFVIEIMRPILEAFGKSGTPKVIAIILNSLFFCSLGLLNLWIITVGK
ncbi:hypothetical protein COD67_13035 [Bacillus cereus]|nr:hypothetical protein COI89_23600 [Bacillus cereus]PGU66511.1 hypothetical protein COD67_13035 [Bacillus cereus]